MKSIMPMIAVVLLLMTVGPLVPESSAYRDYGNNVDGFCLDSDPFNGDCLLCHTASSKSDPTDAKDAYLDYRDGRTGDLCYFCPEDTSCGGGPTCTDGDGDGFAMEGGTCGAVDCDDSDAAVFPGAPEDCTNGVDDDCDGLIDGQDPNAVNCPPACTDLDGDGYNAAGSGCGPADCDDRNASVNPGATENCLNGIDDDCDDLVDGADTDCGGCVPTAMAEKGRRCSDAIDNDCDGSLDCDDADCAGNKSCSSGGGGKEGKGRSCSDGSDNDGDGLTDCADPDCDRNRSCR